MKLIRKIRLFVLIVLLAAAIVLLVLWLRLRAAVTTEQPDSAVQAAQAAMPVPQNKQETLFPGLGSKQIVSILVSTPARSFAFRCEDKDAVSVNGGMADKEIFLTLVSQIEELPVMALDARPVQDTPLLTLTVSTKDAQHTARFYDDGGVGKAAHIAYGTEEQPMYRQTDAWRVGTLMMTCEGTRMLDESGNEVPI